ncbi:MFS transporter [Rummeliibacillus pycnus]|uniref:MFS transporter n=1 Tax=Rummeliibacillus pycnus TaxID=101070 RepID=UPI000C9CB1CE|nr:MFS transporter [Rummeliibacillus pycnus]
MNKQMKKMYFYIFWASLFFERTLWMIFLSNKGYSLIEIGLLQGILNVIMGIFEIPSGIISDKIGRKKSIILGHIFIILYILTFFAYEYYAIVLIGFVLYGIGVSLISGSDQSLVYEGISSDDKEGAYTKFIGKYNAIAIIAIAISALLSGTMYKINELLIFSVTIAAQFIALILIMTVKEIKSSQEKDEENKFSDILKEIKIFVATRKEYKLLIMVIALMQGLVSILYQYGAIMLKDVGFGVQTISISIFILSVVSALASFKIEYLIGKIGKYRIIFLTLLISEILYLAMSIHVALTILAIFMITNILFEIWDTSLNIELHETATNKIRTSLLSICNALTGLLMAAFSIIIGVLNKVVELNMVFMILASSVTIISIFLYLKYLKTIKKV